MQGQKVKCDTFKLILLINGNTLPNREVISRLNLTKIHITRIVYQENY